MPDNVSLKLAALQLLLHASGKGTPNLIRNKILAKCTPLNIAEGLKGGALELLLTSFIE